MRFLMFILTLTLLILNSKADTKLDLNDFVVVKKLTDQKVQVAMKKDMPKNSIHQCNNSNIIGYAVGKFCEENKFGFFDVGYITATEAIGWCYKTDERYSIGITFQDLPDRLVVESLNNKANSEFQVNDEVLMVSGIKTKTLFDIKSVIASTASSVSSKLPIKILRNGKELQINEPAILRSGANWDIKNNWAIYSECLEVKSKIVK